MHTKEPWDCTGCMFPDDDMGGVYYRIQADGMDARAANARRIADCVNALAGIQDPAAFVQAARGMAEALETARDRILDMLEGDDAQSWGEARKALPRIAASFAAFRAQMGEA